MTGYDDDADAIDIDMDDGEKQLILEEIYTDGHDRDAAAATSKTRRHSLSPFIRLAIWWFLSLSLMSMITSLIIYWFFLSPLPLLCSIDIQNLDDQWASIVQYHWTKRHYDSIPPSSITTSQISALYALHPRITRYRWDLRISPHVKWITNTGVEYTFAPSDAEAGSELTYMMLQQMLDAWLIESRDKVPIYMDILINPFDGQEVNIGNIKDIKIPSEPPIFSPSSKDGSMDLPFISPYWYRIHRNLDQVIQQALNTRTNQTISNNCAEQMRYTNHDWNNKKRIALWRGSTTGGEYTKDNYKSYLRTHLVNISKQSHARLIDARFTTCTQCIPKQSNEVQLLLRQELGDWFIGQQQNIEETIEEERSIQVLIDVDGNDWSARFARLLAQGAVVLKQRSPLYEFWYPLLKEYIHYVPINRDLSDLEERTAQVLEQNMYTDTAVNSMIFARTYLILPSMYRYARRMLTVYGEKLQIPP